MSRAWYYVLGMVLGLIACFACCIGGVGALGIQFIDNLGRRQLEDLKSPAGVRIHLYAEDDPDDWPFANHQSLMFEVFYNGRRMCGPNPCGSAKGLPEGFRFHMLSLRNGKLVAIYPETRPHFLLVMYDADTGEIWPLGDWMGGYEAARRDAVGERIAARIRAATGDDAYEFDFFYPVWALGTEED